MLKDSIKNFWNRKPCGTLGVIPAEGDKEYFEKLKKRRYALESFIFKFTPFSKLKNKDVLEIGCGVGTDGLEFANSGSNYMGIDFSNASVELAKKNFILHGYKPNIFIEDAENLPFVDNSFDFIYSWGVIHHTPDINKAVAEIYRVLKPGGDFCVMVYNRYSLVGLQLYILYGFLRFKPFISWKELFAKHHESPGTQAFTDDEASKIFKNFSNAVIKNILTPYDVRISRSHFFPISVMKYLIPSKFGFFKIIRGRK